ncbi:DUF7692 domain-containing protein [Haloarchaeobius sp. DYHT-AS-18]|uniref:DUF7692 domain-containing protein n=1 Tax=Haloarchaeobius sp. DYHT-AS-18 TaxID=3446117 RepID=UPI003EBE4AFF
MRIRTDGDYAYRVDAIEGAAEFYDCNKTKAVVSACEDLPRIVRSITQVLNREDLTDKQQREIAQTLSTAGLSFKVETNITIERS